LPKAKHEDAKIQEETLFDDSSAMIFIYWTFLFKRPFAFYWWTIRCVLWFQKIHRLGVQRW